MKFFNLITLASLLTGTVLFPAHAMDIKEDVLRIGKPGSTAPKAVRFGSSTQGQIRFNPTTGKMEYANDGATFLGIGSGAGGGGGIELLSDNPNFENGISANWVQSTAGTVTARTGANALFDTISARFTPTIVGQTYSSQAYATPAGLAGGQCLASIRYITTEATNLYTLSVLDGSSNVLGTATLTPNATAGVSQNGYVPFTCPAAATTVKLVLTATAASPAFIDLDNAHLGSDNRLADVSQFQLVGGVVMTGCSTAWSNTGTASLTDFTALTGCTYTPFGSAIAPTTMIPAIKFASLPPGEYIIHYEGAIQTNSGGSGWFAFSDGTNTVRELSLIQGASSAVTWPGLQQTINYSTTQSNVTLSLRSRAQAGTLYVNGSTTQPGVITVYRVPTSTETALRVDQLGWHVDATIIGPSNPSLGSANVSTSAPIGIAGLALTNQPGTGVVGAQIPCSGTNASSGSTCASGTPQLGVSFNVPTAGDVLACVTFNHILSTGTSGSIDSAFQIFETPNNNDSTLTQAGKSVTNSALYIASSLTVAPHRNCTALTFSSAGQHTLRLMYKQVMAGTITGNIIGDEGGNNRQVHWEVYPLNYLSGALPVFRGMVTSRAIQGTTTIDTHVIVSGPTYSANDQVDSIMANTNSNAITVTLPSAVTYPGKTYKLTQTSNGFLATWTSVNGAICGQTSIKTTGAGDGLTVQSDGANWVGLNSGCEAKHRLQINMTSSTAGTIVGQDGAWVASLAVSGSGATANYATGTWSGTPMCQVLCYNSNSTVGSVLFGGQSSTSGQFGCVNSSGAFVVNGLIYYSCQGPR